jgi:ribosomal protein S18 acetylase RimI-like enzyme
MLHPNPSVRPYLVSDWDAIKVLHDAARLDELRLSVGVSAFRPLADVASEEGLFEGEVWVADAGGQILGFVARELTEISWLYVDPAHYRRGIGTMLLRHALAGIEGEACTTVLAGNDPALSLYTKHGFKIVETKSGHLNGVPTVSACGHLLRRSVLDG